MAKFGKMREVRDFVDYGSGFPVIVDRVQTVPWGKDDEIIIMDHGRFPEAVLRALAEKPTRLTGNEVRFLRLHYEMPLAEFGKLFDVSHPAVKKWEGKRDVVTGMAWSTEVLIRLFVLNRLGVKARAFQQIYKGLAPPRPAGPCTIQVDLDVDPPRISYTDEPVAEAS
ncbi:MAG: hypothetical protein RBU21_17435 [FCB group bacterium]|jgi:DNA-binding transcriptional regulator YiaG|nr:hypothetical protein [FCB group bacterium]